MFRRLLLCSAALAGLTSCATLAPGRFDSHEIVDCELPGAVVRIGRDYATTGRGRALRTSADDCTVRGGYYTAADQANYETALRTWLPLAEDGDAQAQFYVGQIYEKGLGRAPDANKAASWYLRSAEAGYAAAQTALAMLYESGATGSADPVQALQWYRRAAGLRGSVALGERSGSDDALRLRSELDRLRKDAREQTARLQAEQATLRQQLATLQQELAQARASGDAARLDQAQGALAQTQTRTDNAGQQLDLAARQEQAALQALAQLEADRQREAADPEAPQIQLLQPSSLAMRGLLTVRVDDLTRPVQLNARIRSRTPLRSVTINGRTVPVDAQGLLRTTVPLSGRTEMVEIAALDEAGRRSQLPFVIAGKHVADARPTAQTSTGFGRYHALVIGNARYREWEPLATPHNDAQAVSDTLRDRYGFEVTTLLDATREQIFAALARLRASLGENDNLLVYYSGHGSWDQANLQGYWVPVDGGRGNAAHYISSSDITDQVSVMRARQILVVADACYSGVFVRSVAEQLAPSANDRALMLERAQLRSRKVMSSGNIREVMDGGAGRHSIFASEFIKALSSQSQPYEARQLYGQIAGKVEHVARGFGEQQQPQYGPMRYSGHVGGDFVFVPRPKK